MAVGKNVSTVIHHHALAYCKANTFTGVSGFLIVQTLKNAKHFVDELVFETYTVVGNSYLFKQLIRYFRKSIT